MPAIKPKEIVEALLLAIEESGYSAVIISPVRAHPRRFSVRAPDGSETILSVYIWTLTFGGRESLPNEYRIQMTYVRSPLAIADDGPTVLLGYDPDLKLFAGFDLQRHRTFSPGSSSVQIDREELKRAEIEGLSFHRKTNDEIAVGIRPDQLMSYGLNADRLHRFGKETGVLRLLTQAASLQPITTADVSNLTTERQRIVREVSRLSRLASFRQQVLFAYGARCAVTRVQLRLVDAAHILPVGAPGSLDSVVNGIALSPTYHRAYDLGLIYLDDDYNMRLNNAEIERVRALRLDGGIDAFQAPLGRVFLPPDRHQWPNVEFIRRANKYRSILPV
jgi:putative restriction endonuclease